MLQMSVFTAPRDFGGKQMSSPRASYLTLRNLPVRRFSTNNGHHALGIGHLELRPPYPTTNSTVTQQICLCICPLSFVFTRVTCPWTYMTTSNNEHFWNQRFSPHVQTSPSQNRDWFYPTSTEAKLNPPSRPVVLTAEIKATLGTPVLCCNWPCVANGQLAVMLRRLWWALTQREFSLTSGFAARFHAHEHSRTTVGTERYK